MNLWELKYKNIEFAIADFKSSDSGVIILIMALLFHDSVTRNKQVGWTLKV